MLIEVGCNGFHVVNFGQEGSLLLSFVMAGQRDGVKQGMRASSLVPWGGEIWQKISISSAVSSLLHNILLPSKAPRRYSSHSSQMTLVYNTD